MSPAGYSQRSSYEPFTATQAQRAPTPFPPLGAEGGGAGQGKGGCLVLWEGESTCSLICSSSSLVWERGKGGGAWGGGLWDKGGRVGG